MTALRGKLTGLREYQIWAMKTAGDFGRSNLVYGAMAIAGEAGEVLEAIKKREFHEASIRVEKIAEELGDVLWGVAFLAQRIGYELDTIAAMNIKKLLARYPNGFVPGGGNRGGTEK